MTLGVLCAIRGAREADVVAGLDAAAGLTVVRRCADLAELLAVAEAGLGRVAVVSADLPLLDRTAVAHLRASGVPVVLLVDPEDDARGADDGRGLADRARAWGADDVVGPLAADLAPRVARAALAGVTAPAGRAPRVDDAAVGPPWRGEPVPGRTAPSDPSGPPPPDGGQGPPDGRLVAVWGPTGAPGRSTIALNLAAELAAAGQPVVLADADTYGGTLAQRLGLLDEAPGIAAACRAAAHGTLDLQVLAGIAREAHPGLRVLTGLPRADRWAELAESALEAVWQVARRLAPWVVVDCGFGVERDEALQYDVRAPRRNGATLSALAHADRLVVVGAADPVGIERLVRALLDLDDLPEVAGVPRDVVVTRVRASAVGAHPARAVQEALARYAGVGGVHLVPEDREAHDRALLAGRTLREAARGSAARRAITDLARHLCTTPTATGPRAAH